MIRVTSHRKQLYYLRGGAYRSPLAGVGFTLGGLSMVGLPLLGGFVTKLFLADASFGLGPMNLIAFVILAISSVMNALYYIPVIILIWTPGNPLEEEAWAGASPYLTQPEESGASPALSTPVPFVIAAPVLMAGVVALGVFCAPVSALLAQGLTLL